MWVKKAPRTMVLLADGYVLIELPETCATVDAVVLMVETHPTDSLSNPSYHLYRLSCFEVDQLS